MQVHIKVEISLNAICLCLILECLFTWCTNVDDIHTKKTIAQFELVSEAIVVKVLCASFDSG